jgi:cysteine-rich repeat protein
MRPVPSSQALLALLAVAVLASASTCEPPAPVDDARPVTFVSAADRTVEHNKKTTVTVTSLTAELTRASGDVTVTVAPGITRDRDGKVIPDVTVENAAFIAPIDTDPTEATATATLENGEAAFEFLCNPTGLTEDVEVELTVAGPNSTTARTTVVCEPQVIKRLITFSKADCAARLQADGDSTCVVNMTVRDLNNTVAPGVTVDVSVESTVRAGTGGSGNANVLSATENGQRAQKLEGLETDVSGVASFYIASPELRLEQTINLIATDDAGNSGKESFVIAPFEDKSQVSIVALPASISSGGTTRVTVTGRALNGDLAVGGEATITITGELTATPEGCLAQQGESLKATLTDGTCAFNLLAGNIGVAAATAQVAATFQAATAGAQRIASTTVTVNPANVSIATVSLSEPLIFADAQPSTTTVTVSTSRNGVPRQGARVTATVSPDATGVVRFISTRVGTAAPLAAANQDTATVVAGVDGVVSFTVTSDNPLSRGNGRILLAVTDPQTTQAFDVVDPANVTVTVDRAPLLSTLVFDSFDGPKVIGVPGGPLASSTGLKFKLLDEQNLPVANTPVRFVAQSSVPGVVVVPFGTSNSDGIVKTVVTAGPVAGPVTVVALIDSPALSAVSEAVSIVGGVPNSAYTSLVCTKIAGADPSTACKVTLADKFTNLATTTTRVQFRAEGGNITPSAEATGGTATANFVAGPPGVGSADIRLWTYSPLRNVPPVLKQAPATRETSNGTVSAAGCFDDTIRTPCDLYALCADERAEARLFCPLPPSVSGDPTSCVADIDELALSALDNERNNPAWEFGLYDNDPDIIAEFTEYVATGRSCGPVLGCLVGDYDGLSLDPSDDCPVNAGCLDFSALTECPQDGLVDILAAVRGEEAFDDQNGNGRRDEGEPFDDVNSNGFRDNTESLREPFTDQNNNGVYDSPENFVDFPEPFLDKNSSCSFDSLNANPRLTASQKVQLSDLFIDSDPDDGRFGFQTDGQRLESNGIFDSDTEIFVKTAVVQLGPPGLQFGVRVANPNDCGQNGTSLLACPAEAQAQRNSQSLCTETALREAILQGCSIGEPSCGPVSPTCPADVGFRDGELVVYVFRWTDTNGNCPTDDFAGSPAIDTDGPIEVTFNDGPYSPGECGGAIGDPNTKNIERPWCEEHPFLGAPTREVTIRADCASETGDRPATLRFSLGDAVVPVSFTVSCPLCGDLRVEGSETCDDGNTIPGDGCDEACAIEDAP